MPGRRARRVATVTGGPGVEERAREGLPEVPRGPEHERSRRR